MTNFSEAKFTIRAINKTQKAFAQINEGVNRMDRRFAKLSSRMGSMKGMIAAVFAGVAVKSVLDTTDKIHKFSLVTQIATEDLAELKFAGEQSGVGFDQLKTAIKKVGKSVSDASRGLKTQKDALADLGLTSEELIALPLDKQFEIIGDRLRGVENQGDKVRIAMDLMGRSGADLIAMFSGGSQSIADLRGELRDLGGAVTQEQADQLAAINDAWNKVTTAASGFVRVILAELGPALEAALEWIAKITAKLGEMTTKFKDGISAITIKTYELLGIIDEDVAQLAMEELADKWDDTGKKTKSALESVKAYKSEMKNLAVDDDLKKANKEMEKEAERAAGQIRDAFKGGIKSIITDFDNLGDAVRNTMSRIADVMLDSQIDSLFGGSGGNGDGGLGGMLSGLLGGSSAGNGGGGMFGDLGSMFGGFFADGGAFSAGKPIVVGERGPELIMPGRSGTVVPNHALQASAPVNVTMNISTPDARSFRASQAQTATQMAAAINTAQRRNL